MKKKKPLIKSITIKQSPSIKVSAEERRMAALVAERRQKEEDFNSIDQFDFIEEIIGSHSIPLKVVFDASSENDPRPYILYMTNIDMDKFLKDMSNDRLFRIRMKPDARLIPQIERIIAYYERNYIDSE